MRPHTCVYESMCAHVCKCACTPVCPLPPSGHPSLARSLFHVTRHPPEAVLGRVQCSGPLETGRGAPRVQPDAGTGKDQGCRAVCRDSRLPDGPSGPRRFLHLAGPWVPPISPGDPGAAGPRPAGPRGARLPQRALQPRPRILLSGALRPRAPRLPNCAAAGFWPPHLPRLCRLLPLPREKAVQSGSLLGLTSQVPENPAVAKTHVGHDSRGASGQTPD